MAQDRRGDLLFLGTGIMGLPMARRLCAAGHRVSVWNRDTAKARPLAVDGARVLTSLSEVDRAVHTAIIMVSNGDAVDAVLFNGDGSLAKRLAPGSTVVVMSSIPVERARAQARALEEMGIAYVDAPVSGGERGATDGTLAIMAGGDAETIASLAPVFATLGRVTHVGPAGSGSLAKLANQMIVGITIGAVAEALALAELGGADAAAVRTALGGGFADSTVLDQHGARMLERRFAPGAHVSTQIKDLSTALALAQSLGGEFPLLATTGALFEALAASGAGALDHSALYLDARKRAGLPPS